MHKGTAPSELCGLLKQRKVDKDVKVGAGPGGGVGEKGVGVEMMACMEFQKNQ